MNLFQRFITSIYKFDEYNKLIKTSLSSSIGYYAAVSLIVIIISGISIFNVFSVIMDGVEEKIPEFTIENGQMSAEDKIDTNLGGTVIILDTDEDDAQTLQDKAKDYMQGLFVSKNNIIINQKFTGRNDKFSFKDVVPGGFTKADLEEVFVVMRAVYKVMIVVFLVIFRCVFLLFVGCIAKLMSNIMRGGLSFGDSLKLGIYGSTLAVLLRCILMFFTPMGLPDIIYYCVIMVYIYLGINNCKKMMAV